MEKATMLKTKRYKFGKSLVKGQSVLIKNTDGILTAFINEDDALGFGVKEKDIQYDKEKFAGGLVEGWIAPILIKAGDERVIVNGHNRLK